MKNIQEIQLIFLPHIHKIIHRQFNYKYIPSSIYQDGNFQYKMDKENTPVSSFSVFIGCQISGFLYKGGN